MTLTRSPAFAPLILPPANQSAHYVHLTEAGPGWSYAYDIHAPGTRSERRTGVLRASGLRRLLESAAPGDRIQTPWGVMLRVLDTVYERGFLLERVPGQPLEWPDGAVLPVPDDMLVRGGRWSAHAGAWCYRLLATAMETKSEHRTGRLYFGGAELRGRNQGDRVDTPWETLRWTGADSSAYGEQGFLLRGAHDRALDDLDGTLVFPGDAGVIRLASLYSHAGFRLDEDGSPFHALALELSGRPDHASALTGVLTLDPNQCRLNEFGDQESCTRVAVRRMTTIVTLQRLADPRHRGRRYFEVAAEDLRQPLGLVVQGKLERCYITAGQQVLALHLDGLPLGDDKRAGPEWPRSDSVPIPDIDSVPIPD